MKPQELFDRLNSLKRIPRTGWLLCNVPLAEVEDVAQHTFDVATITLLLVDELERKGTKLDKERALSMALVHDWAEVSIGDFPYTALKHLGPAGVKKKIEERALRGLLHGLPEKERYMGLWREYSEKRTLESKLVHTADYVSILIQAVKYRERGNRSREIGELCRAVQKDLQPYIREFPWVRGIVTGLRRKFNSV